MSYIGKIEYCNYILKEYENKLSTVKDALDHQVELIGQMFSTMYNEEQVKQAQNAIIDAEKEHNDIAKITFQRLKQFIIEGEKYEN